MRSRVWAATQGMILKEVKKKLISKNKIPTGKTKRNNNTVLNRDVYRTRSDQRKTAQNPKRQSATQMTTEAENSFSALRKLVLSE